MAYFTEGKAPDFNIDGLLDEYIQVSHQNKMLLKLCAYPLMAITSFTKVGSICLSMLSIPCFRVTVEDGQPLQAP